MAQQSKRSTNCRSRDLQSSVERSYPREGESPEELDASQLLCLVPLLGDTFSMGSKDRWAELDEHPPHSVLVDSFWLSKYEITNTQLRYVLQWALDHGKILRTDSMLMNTEGDQQPLLDLSRSGFHLERGQISIDEATGSQPCIEISWYGAQAFCNYLSEIENLEQCIDFSDWTCDFGKGGYRLPTEAEWEFACRAATDTDFPSGDLVHPIYDPVDPNLDAIGWYRGNIEGFIHRVGEKTPNRWGLYDMNGGVAEWCYDWYDREYYKQSPLVDPQGPKNGEERVKRGGSSFDIAKHCRSSYRGLSEPDASYGDLGFRPARSWVE